MNKLFTLSFLSFLLISTQAESQITNRWYNYSQYLSNTTAVDSFTLNLWNDTTAKFYSTPNKFNSVGMTLDPALDAWNNVALYGITMKVSPSNNYVIDSIIINPRFCIRNFGSDLMAV